MPIVTVHVTAGELFQGALDEARKLTEEIHRLSDIVKAPFDPGEGEATRYHRIAKLGKKLADMFKSIDDFMSMVNDAHAMHAEQHQPPSGDKPDEKAN